MPYQFAPTGDLSLEEVFEAYFDCRVNKRNSQSQLAFEIALESNLISLYQEVQSRQYHPLPSTVFVVTEPRPREVWCADYRDRVVHHIIYNRLAPMMHRLFVPTSYACIPGRGIHAAVDKTAQYARRITRNYTRQAHYLKADIANFFVSINKKILYRRLRPFLAEEWLHYLVRKTIFCDVTQGCIINSHPSKFCLVPPIKSLWRAKRDHGLPIGNLTSQFFANVYLDGLDRFVKRELGCRHYLRYVDDFILMHEDPKWLESAWHYIEDFLLNNLDLVLHPKKRTLNAVNKGIDFVGYFVLPGRIYPRHDTLRRMAKRFCTFDDPRDFGQLQSINSCLGYLKYGNSYRIRARQCKHLSLRGFEFSDKGATAAPTSTMISPSGD